MSTAAGAAACMYESHTWFSKAKSASCLASACLAISQAAPAQQETAANAQHSREADLYDSR